MKIAQTGLRLLPAAAVLVAISLLGSTPASAQCGGGPSYAGGVVYSQYPAYDYSMRGGYSAYGYRYPYHRGDGVYHHSYRPNYHGYHYGRYGRGYSSHYGGGLGYRGGGHGYWGGHGH